MELLHRTLRPNPFTIELRFDDLPDVYERAAVAEAVTAIADSVAAVPDAGLRERSFVRDPDDRGVTVRLVFDRGV